MPVSQFCITVSALNPSGTGVTGSGLLASITFGNFAGREYSVAIGEDPFRGGVVGDNIASVILPSGPVAVAVPEPATAALLAVGALLIRKHRFE